MSSILKLVIEPAMCKGCGICIAECPKKALTRSSEANAAGYQYVEVDDEKCIKCGICYTVCPDYVFSIVEV